jgi:hypothetical protein
MNSADSLKVQLLMTLSYYEPMSQEFIYLDLDQSFLLANPELTVEDLKDALSELEKENKIKKISDKNASKWIRLFPKKSLWQRFRRLLA